MIRTLADTALDPQALGGRPDQNWTLEVLTGITRQAGRPVQLTPRELELLMALALGGPATADHLASKLWPDAELDRALNLVKVYTHRVRRRLGHAVIQCSRGVYRVSPEVAIDVREIERRLQDGPLDAGGSRERDAAILELARRLRTERAPESRAWEWFAWEDERLTQLGRRTAIAVGRAAFTRGEHATSIRISAELSCEDPCDEETRELAIRSYLVAGEQGAAVQEYRRYATTLRKELDAAPSLEVRSLFTQFAGVAV